MVRVDEEGGSAPVMRGKEGEEGEETGKGRAGRAMGRGEEGGNE